MKKEVTLKRIIVNALFIALIIIGIAVAAHFGLRSATRHNARRTVPEFKGISLSEAQLLAKQNDLEIHINDSLYVMEYPGGTVLDQLPASGVEVKPDRTIYIVINAFGKRKVDVPFVAGRSLRQAKNMLEVAGLEIAKLKYIPDMATNYVLAQSYQGDQILASSKRKATAGSGVDLTVGVSSDDPYTYIPNVIGLTLKEAKSRIWESGMNVGAIKMDKGVNLLRDKNAKVYIQGSAANQAVKWGSSISVTLTTDQKKVNNMVEDARKADLEYEKSLSVNSKEDENE